jgi:prevent-host-death family protein
MNAVTANELKTRGVSVIENRLKTGEEVIISVRGQSKYVVLSLETYARLREYELDMALQEARADYKAGRMVSESVDDHMKRVTDAI